MKTQPHFGFPRTVLLIEIERYCSFLDCGERATVGLTKNEALTYQGFECLTCNRWNEDSLTEKDIPEWWNEIKTSKDLS